MMEKSPEQPVSKQDEVSSSVLSSGEVAGSSGGVEVDVKRDDAVAVVAGGVVSNGGSGYSGLLILVFCCCVCDSFSSVSKSEIIDILCIVAYT